MHLRRSITAGFVAAVMVLLPVTSASADTSTPEPTLDSFSISSPMVAGGYDAQVAEANGFKIVTHADGSQESVPVTDAAVALLEQANERRAAAQQSAPSGEVGTYGFVDGWCGSSFATGAKLANNTVAFNTGFAVFLKVYEHTWTVYATGFISANSWTTSGSGPATGNASWSGAIPGVVGPGIGGVPWGVSSAVAILVDGTACFSQGPTFTFG